MAIRNIVKIGDDVLRKICRTQLTFDDKLATILDDMAETMYKAEGVGLAAPQIGILRRFCVVDVGDGLIELINPVIIEKSGSQTGSDLSGTPDPGDSHPVLLCRGFRGENRVGLRHPGRYGEIPP